MRKLAQEDELKLAGQGNLLTRARQLCNGSGSRMCAVPKLIVTFLS